MTTWRNVPWEYDAYNGRVIADVSGITVTVCRIPRGQDTNSIGRAIAFAWNMDLVQAQWARELFSVDDSVVNVQDSAPSSHPRR